MDMYKYFKRYAQQFFQAVLHRDVIQFLIFFITSQCNCRCGTCFYWKRLNKTDDLSPEEIRKTSERLGKIHTLLLSGGEPFLRDDILEICRLFIRQNELAILAVPTNGSRTSRIAEFARAILTEFPELTLTIAVSLDGFKETHDKIRGVEGMFDSATETLGALATLRGQYDKLEVVVNTVITNKNSGELEKFSDYVHENLDVDYQDFEILRGEYKDGSLSLMPINEIREIHRFILKNRERYLNNRKAGFLERLAVIGLLAYTQSIKERSLSQDKASLVCSAGRNICAIDANGDVRLCELLSPVGNLRTADHNLYSVLRSREARKARDRIVRERCHCTHVCFIKKTASGYLRSLIFIVYYYIIYRMKNGKI